MRSDVAAQKAGRRTHPIRHREAVCPALTVPRLTDGIVFLRPPAEGDAGAIFAACQDPQIHRFTALPAPYELHHATDWIHAAPEAWRTRTAAPMVVLDVASDEILGACGLLEIHGDQAEIGYWMMREARGRGVATRAVSLVTEWGLTDVGLSLIELLADVGNLASHRVAEKAGYTLTGEAPAPVRCASRCDRVLRFVRSAGGR
jgi:RimJ/RimL family protein N-acetyltransferase